MEGMLTALRVIAACVISGAAGWARLQDPVPATQHELMAWVGLAFFGTIGLTGLLISLARGNDASL